MTVEREQDPRPAPAGPSEEDAALAAHRAKEVVGLYGDPDVTWGISLEAVFSEPIDLDGLGPRLRGLVAEHPHLGQVPEVERVAPEQWAHAREASASADFSPETGLVRVLVSTDARSVFVTAHHGVCDGLGLIALVAAVSGRPLTSSARGVGNRPAAQGFLLSSVLRLGEALFNPPARFSGSHSTPAPGTPERLVQRDDVVGRVNGTTVSAALLAIHARWPRRRSSGGRRFLTVMGASRRVPGTTAPDRQTAYLRIPLRPGWDRSRVAAALAESVPEPDFPETSAKGVGPMVTRLLKNRLGYTVNVSNLGLVHGQGLVRMAMFPAVNGPQAVGVGVVSTPQHSTVSLRTRRGDFSDAEAESLLGQVVQELDV